ncbi:M10 family metallopeptidase [Oleisolibacter albus]|uniref:M10 family metallopeptidase n=1 Tax=Oleisolibacter albus TaxID=2171757 RepID=UPI0013904ED1|nr:M10 family metallopeptidase [Oleisolibacter albus]
MSAPPPGTIDAVIYGGTRFWKAASASTGATTVSYSFLTSTPSYYPAGWTEWKGMTPFTAAQQAATQDILSMVSSVANIRFVQTAQTATSAGDITFGNAKNTSATGWAYGPGVKMGGDVWISSSKAGYDAPVVGTKSYFAILHELGHALGLKHTGDYGDGEGPFLPKAQDNEQYTVMSYNLHPGMGSVRPATLQLYDIAALQYLYGANMSYQAGDTVYRFAGTKDLIATYWDGGGIDTFDASGETATVCIDLNDGAFSSIGLCGTKAAKNNIAIAYGAEIENATGGAGNDTLTGNALDNVLRGGAGNDTITGGKGNDTIDGGSGTDKAVYSDIRAHYTVSVLDDGIRITHSGDGSDVVRNVEQFSFADGTFTLDQLRPVPPVASLPPAPTAPSPTPVPVPAPDATVLTGTAASELTTGTKGADIFLSSAGNDRLSTPLDGACDLFVFSKGFQGDRIFNFELGIDKLDLTSFGIDSLGDGRLSLAQGGSGVQLDLGGGDKIVLNGISMTDLLKHDVLVPHDQGYFLTA